MLQIRNPISAIRLGGIRFLRSRPSCGASGISRPGALSGKAPRLRFWGNVFGEGRSARPATAFPSSFSGGENAFPPLALSRPAPRAQPPRLEARSRRRCPDLSGWRARPRWSDPHTRDQRDPAPGGPQGSGRGQDGFQRPRRTGLGSQRSGCVPRRGRGCP